MCSPWADIMMILHKIGQLLWQPTFHFRMGSHEARRMWNLSITLALFFTMQYHWLVCRWVLGKWHYGIFYVFTRHHTNVVSFENFIKHVNEQVFFHEFISTGEHDQSSCANTLVDFILEFFTSLGTSILLSFVFEMTLKRICQMHHW